MYENGKCYKFSHWSLGEGTTEPGGNGKTYPTVTVEKGTSGDLTFIANWVEQAGTVEPVDPHDPVEPADPTEPTEQTKPSSSLKRNRKPERSKSGLLLCWQAISGIGIISVFAVPGLRQKGRGTVNK